MKHYIMPKKKGKIVFTSIKNEFNLYLKEKLIQKKS